MKKQHGPKTSMENVDALLFYMICSLPKDDTKLMINSMTIQIKFYNVLN